MDNSFDRYQKRRLRSSYFSVIVSIALVLFLVGLFGLVVIKTKSLTAHFKEKITITVFLKDAAKTRDVDILIAELKKADYTNSVTYVSKETAAKQHSEDLGEDFLELLGENPLKNGLDITLKSEFVTPVKMDEIQHNLGIRSIVDEVVFDKPLIETLTRNFNKVSFWMLLFSAVFTLIAVVLINSSIRLSIYSKRFTLKTMQMVGATKRFIRLPFIWQSVRLGIYGALVAILALVVFAVYINNTIPELELLSDYKLFGYLGIGVVILGICITWMSTFFATQRFLNLRTDELYY